MQGILNKSWNYERTLVFSHIVPNKTLDICRSREIRSTILRITELWERGIYASMVGTQRQRELPGKSGPPEEERRRNKLSV